MAYLLPVSLAHK